MEMFNAKSRNVSWTPTLHTAQGNSMLVQNSTDSSNVCDWLLLQPDLTYRSLTSSQQGSLALHWTYSGFKGERALAEEASPRVAQLEVFMLI